MTVDGCGERESHSFPVASAKVLQPQRMTPDLSIAGIRDYRENWRKEVGNVCVCTCMCVCMCCAVRMKVKKMGLV